MASQFTYRPNGVNAHLIKQIQLDALDP